MFEIIINENCMTTVKAKRFQAWRTTVCLVLFVLMYLGVHSSAQASCGDYLLHDYGRVSVTNHHYRHSTNVAVALPADLYQTLPQRSAPPGSACEGGRCHSSPLPMPVDPIRIFIAKQSADVSDIGGNCSHRDDPSWARPEDGSLPYPPYRDVASPPPRHA